MTSRIFIIITSLICILFLAFSPVTKVENHQLVSKRITPKAVTLMLARNRELPDVLHSLEQWERRFNAKFKYPYVFINDEPFTKEFQDKVTRLIGNFRRIEFGIIPEEHWQHPPGTNMQLADTFRQEMERKGIIYGGSQSYRYMCRWFSGLFYKHPLLLKYDWIMRLEPDVDFYCNIDYDIFQFLQDNGKVYGFNMIPLEIPETIPSLFPLVLHFAKYRNLLNSSDLIRFFMNQDYSYNLCHFWTNFEVVNLNLLRTSAYEDYFQYLEAWAGTALERWGDGPIISLGIGLFANYSQVHFFDDIGYRHSGMGRCPTNRSKCDCPWDANFDTSPHSCLNMWKNYKPRTS